MTAAYQYKGIGTPIGADSSKESLFPPPPSPLGTPSRILILYPQPRAGLTELRRAGAMVLLMWSTAFRTPGERGRLASQGQAGAGLIWEGQEEDSKEGVTLQEGQGLQEVRA